MPQFVSAPSVAPNRDFTVHIVLDDFGKAGIAYRETDEAEADRETVIADLIAGQFENPRRIVAFNTAEGWSRDVSEDIARAVVDKAIKERTWLPSNTREFVERQIGNEVPSELVG